MQKSNTLNKNSNILLSAQDITCERDEVIVLDSINLTLLHGELIHVSGVNGSGKTTLLKILSGLIISFEGNVWWQGKSLNSNYYDYARNRLYCGHLTGIKPTLTPVENLTWLFSGDSNISLPDIVKALKEVSLSGYEYSQCQTLSAGQKRRVMLARLLLSSAPLWILDEPFTSLDKAGIKWLESLILNKIKLGGSVILTSHHTLEHFSDFGITPKIMTLPAHASVI
jgi:heme exporter protein A